MPPAVVTVSVPGVRPAGAVAWSSVSLTTVNAAASRPLKRTWVVPTKWEPIRFTTVPGERTVGPKPLMTGGWAASTVKAAELTVPVEVVTWMGPVVASPGTTAWT